MALHFLDDEDAAFIRLLKAAYDNGDLRFSAYPSRRPLWSPYGGQFGKANAPIAATTVGSTVVSHGTCTIWTFTSSTGHSIVATTQTLEAYNLSTLPVSTGTLLQFKRHILTGLMLCDFESCT